MKLNHLNLPVADVAAARSFFTDYFGFTDIMGKLSDKMSVLRNQDNFTLVLMSDELNGAANKAYPEPFHIGFLLDENAQVDALHAKLKAGGIRLPQAPQRIRKTYGFYFHHQGFMIEVAVMDVL